MPQNAMDAQFVFCMNQGVEMAQQARKKQPGNSASSLGGKDNKEKAIIYSKEFLDGATGSVLMRLELEARIGRNP